MQTGDPYHVANFDWPRESFFGASGHDNALIDLFGALFAPREFFLGAHQKILMRRRRTACKTATRLAPQLLDFLARFLQFSLHHRARFGDHRTPRLLDLGKLLAQVGFEQLSLPLARLGARRRLERLLFGAAAVV